MILLLDVAPVFVHDTVAEEAQSYLITSECILFTMTVTKGKRDYFYSYEATEENIGSVITMNLVIPLPPQEEQKHIIARVEELLALCDRLT